MTGEEKVNENVVETTLTSISDLGKVADEKEVIKGHKVKLETLTSGEEDNVLRGLDDSMNVLERFHHLKRLTVIYATKKYNGIEITDGDGTEKNPGNRAIVRNFYLNLQTSLLTPFYDFYLELVDKQKKIIDELKKK